MDCVMNNLVSNTPIILEYPVLCKAVVYGSWSIASGDLIIIIIFYLVTEAEITTQHYQSYNIFSWALIDISLHDWIYGSNK